MAIREIVASFRVWESHSPTPALGPEVPVVVILDNSTDDSSSGQRKGDPGVSDWPTDCRDSREFLSKLMAAFRQSVHQGIPAELDLDTPPVAPLEVVALLCQMESPEITLTDIPSTERGDGVLFMRPIRTWGQPVLSCGHRFSFYASGMVG